MSVVKTHGATIKEKYLVLHVKCPIFWGDWRKIWSFLARFSQKSPLPDFNEICPVGVTLIREDRWTDMTFLTGAVRDYENVSQIKHNFARWKLESSCPLPGFSVHGRKISRRIVRKLNFRTRTLIVWLSVGSSGRFWTRTLAFRLRTRRGISCISELILASQI